MDNTDRNDLQLDSETIGRTVNLSDGKLNNSQENIENNIKSNIRRGLPQLRRYEDNPQKLILVAGGPSLNDTVDDLKMLASQGHPVVALNGASDWLDANNIPYHSHVLLDSRPFNARFVGNPKDHVKYFVCSQCDPSVFDALDGYNVHIWHGGTAKFVKSEMDQVYGEGKYIHVKTGRTVVLAALYVFRTLGYSEYEVFGFDSCLMDDEHHAYSQPENNLATLVQFSVNDRMFVAHPWMIGQAQDFLKMTKVLGHKFDISVHGDGLIAHLIESIAETGKLDFHEENDLDQTVWNMAANI